MSWVLSSMVNFFRYLFCKYILKFSYPKDEESSRNTEVTPHIYVDVFLGKSNSQACSPKSYLVSYTMISIEILINNFVAPGKHILIRLWRCRIVMSRRVG